MSILTDLDNNLQADELYSGITRGLVESIPQTPTKTPDPTPTPRGGVTGDGTGGVKPLTLTPSPTTVVTQSPDIPSIPRYVSPTEVSEEGEETIDDGMSGGYGGGGGGGGGMPPAEEEMPAEEGARLDEDKKILGLDQKVFYGLLVALAVGGYYLYSRKKK